jgi:biopolymer transport protein TolQ
VQIWEAFQHSGWVGKVVLAVLLFFSVVSWAVMIMVWFRFNRAGKASSHFLDEFRRSKRLADVRQAAGRWTSSPLAGIFKSGYAEIEMLMAGKDDHKLNTLVPVERSLHRASRVETGRLTKMLPFLATTASATPFIGLFGTVWGIMGAFAAIGTSGGTSIVVVAPGISEALINTAAGLFAAIPALIGYNHFANRVREARAQMEDFALEFLNLTQRTFM